MKDLLIFINIIIKARYNRSYKLIILKINFKIYLKLYNNYEIFEVYLKLRR